MSWRLFITLAVLIALWGLWSLALVSFSFGRLGLSPTTALVVLGASLLGGWINVPIWRFPGRRPRAAAVQAPVAWRLAPGWWYFYTPPPLPQHVLAINLGGALIPLAVDAYLLPRIPLAPAVAAIAVVALACYLLARPVEGVGIVLPTLLPGILAAVLAILLAPGNAPGVAYVAGTLGTLIGADLLHLPEFKNTRSSVISIGGAGLHDGIFVAGLIATLLA